MYAGQGEFDFSYLTDFKSSLFSDNAVKNGKDKPQAKGMTAPGYLPPLYPVNRVKPKLFPDRKEYETSGPTRLKVIADEIHHKGDLTTATGTSGLSTGI